MCTYAPINVKPEGGGGGNGADVRHLTFCEIFFQFPRPRDENFGQNQSNIPTQNFCSVFFVNFFVIYNMYTFLFYRIFRFLF